MCDLTFTIQSNSAKIPAAVAGLAVASLVAMAGKLACRLSPADVWLALCILQGSIYSMQHI